MSNDFDNMGFDPQAFFDKLRKSASVKAGAIMFGQAQMAYFEVLKQELPEEEAYNLLAHTTECILKSVALAAGPVTDALLSAAITTDALNLKRSDKEVPGA